MVRLKFIIKQNALALRISEGKERYYRQVRHLLVGVPDLKFWDADKERFTHRCTAYVENNKALEEYKAIYQRLIAEYPELTARQVSVFYKYGKMRTTEQHEPYRNSVVEFLKVVIAREKNKPGCNFEFYDKLLKKCMKILPRFADMTFQSINYESCLRIAQICGKHPNYRGTTKSFRALLGKADKDRDVDFSIKQIGDFRFQDFNPDKYNEGIEPPDVLSPEHLKLFLNIDVDNITPAYSRKKVCLYYDFCLFMFYSFFAPCDVIKLEYKNITKRNTIVMRRKKTCKMVEVPILPEMAEIIERYKPESDGKHIFPILSIRTKKKEYATRDYHYKLFRESLNLWLKSVSLELGFDMRLYSYVFRHTAITTALNGGLSLSYVSMIAGASIDTLQRYYYNGTVMNNQERLFSIFEQAKR